MAQPSPDVLIVSLGSTAGLRRADEELEASLSRAGARVRLVRARRPRELPTLALTDLAWALAARRAALDALGAPGGPPWSIIYSTTTAALLWPRPGAIRFDALAAANRPGRHGLWQRPLERRRLARAELLLPWSSQALAESPAAAALRAEAIVVPVPVPDVPEPAEGSGRREIAAITYGANPSKKGLDRVLAAWRQARAGGGLDGEELVVAGVGAEELGRSGIDVEREPGVRLVGRLPAGEYRSLLARARVFVTAPRREDYGIAQLEALAAGCMLVTTPAPGPYVALEIARALDPRLVGWQLAQSLRAALLDPSGDYARRASAALAPLRPAAVDEIVATRLAPRLLRQPS